MITLIVTSFISPLTLSVYEKVLSSIGAFLGTIFKSAMFLVCCGTYACASSPMFAIFVLPPFSYIMKLYY